MIAEFRLPDLGEGLPEAEIVSWHVAEGDTVALNQTIADVETAKAIVEIPSPYAGTVTALRHAEGDVVPVGEVILAVEVAAGDDDVLPNLVGYGAAPRSDARPRRRARGAGAATAVVEAGSRAPHDDLPPDASPLTGPVERPRSTPPVRTLARELGVDLAAVAGTGPDGLIVRADVERAAAAATPVRTSGPDSVAGSEVAASARSEREVPVGPDVREVRIPVRGVRKQTAAAMVASAFTAPHVTCFLDVDVTGSLRLLDELRADPALEGRRLGILALAARATCLALGRHGDLNARFEVEASEIVQYRHVDLGIAVATERGLIVPHIPDAQRLGLVELSDALGSLAERARAGRSGVAELSGGTFSITNFGVFGVDSGTPILPPGQSGILGLGAVRRRPWEHEGELALRDVMTLSLSFDHRVADGAEGSRLLAAIGGLLRDPARALLYG
ncbi:dihydrolipoamide acetyltransferase family protein [Microbacterium telephonicum]|uniref:Dihydrolipoamide acetyltransferase component of pyruvate dehydrogenase complex n=1 Tax=Microbacterium telephonicum TaxID=1714841 RepID=A0A498C9J7_9MICO|nr:dihydrolipoamide acetyltransferase family protein [Microbacterium telephonicum]RLK49560.1 pyruvate dehydrogenase E2 component (dihydrolipoamide acetyltransferase) [Microbacterium telephonicum]